MNSLLSGVRTAVELGRAPAPEVRIALTESADPAQLRRAGRMLAALRPQDAQLRAVRVAILATCTTGALPHLIRATMVGAGLEPTLEVVEYGLFELTLARAGYPDGDPDLVACLLDDAYFMPADWAAGDVAGLTGSVHGRLADLRSLVAGSTSRSAATMVLHTVPLPTEVLDTLLSWRDRAAFAQSWHQLNAGILALAAEFAHVVVVDLVSLLAAEPVATPRRAPAPVRESALHGRGAARPGPPGGPGRPGPGRPVPQGARARPGQHPLGRRAR